MDKMASMKLSKTEKKADSPVVAGDTPDYPWGLRLNLDEAALKKLGITELPDADAECRIAAVGTVIAVASSTRDGKQSRSVEIQITKLSMHSDDKDDAKESFKKGYEKGNGR